MDDFETDKISTTTTTAVCIKDEKTTYTNRTAVHRLFYVEHDCYASDNVFKLADDPHHLCQVTNALHRLDFNQSEIFAAFGDRDALKSYLQSLFPDVQAEIQRLFNDSDPMPSIWAFYNAKYIVFALIFAKDEHPSDTTNSLTIVMQRFLQDLYEHSFHSKAHSIQTYRQVENEIDNIRPAQVVKLINVNNLISSIHQKNTNVLISNTTENTYCVEKTFQETNPTEFEKKIQRLKQLLDGRIDFETMDFSSIVENGRRSGILLSKYQRKKIKERIASQRKAFEAEKEQIKKDLKSLIDGLIGRSHTLFHFHRSIREKLLDEIIMWSLSPILDDETPDELATRITQMFQRHRREKSLNGNIVPEQIRHFVSELQRLNPRDRMRQSKQNMIDLICLEIQSENGFEGFYDIHRLKYSFSNNDTLISDLTINSNDPIRLTFNDLGQTTNLLDLNEADRRVVFHQIEFIACFKTYDASGEIIVMKTPKVIDSKLDPGHRYSVLFHKNATYRSTGEFYIEKAHFAFAANAKSQTLIIYNIDAGRVIKCFINDFGQKSTSSALHLNDRSNEPPDVKSLALTVAQDLLILIDSNSKVYSIEVSKQNEAMISVLCKGTGSSIHQSNFKANTGEVYERVQTIGERSPIFFFQAQSSIDIIDQNYTQIASISLNQHHHSYDMQIFTDYLNTYCVLFNAYESEAHCIQNLISDTRIEQDKSVTDLHKTTKQNNGNSLIDIIKYGEIQFGKPDFCDENHYHFLLPTNRLEFSHRCRQYFEKLSVKGKLMLNHARSEFIESTLDTEKLCRVLLTRVPLQICTIKTGTFIPLSAGRRDEIDYFSSKSFRIEEKAREISFSSLEQILNKIDGDIRIVGVIGRQSTGKSYLMNCIFRTRFAVAAGRCTDGIWMSYTVIDDQDFLVLDCEGLFSDQRTEDEEIKLIAYLTAVCDITILSQDSGFNRYLDRLFNSLSKAVEKISRNDKLFQGILMVAVRDISDSNADDSRDAAIKKFYELQRRGQSSFLRELFSNSFQIQLLHYFDNQSFDDEIDQLRDLFVKHKKKNRWQNGKELAERLKILLIQLYTDDFIDSNQIHTNMKLAELENQGKRSWLTFEFQDDSNKIIYEQEISKISGEKSYSFKLNHSKLRFDENPSEANFDCICELIISHLTDFDQQSKEKQNEMLDLINKLIDDVLDHRREQVKKYLRDQFQKNFSNENDAIKERRAKLLDIINEYMLAFKFQFCLKKCHDCNLKCRRYAKHSEEVKDRLEKKKEQLRELKTTVDGKLTDDQQRVSIKSLCKAKEEVNNFSNQRVRLSDELVYLKIKEELEKDLQQCKFQLKTNETNQQTLKKKLSEIEENISKLFPLEEDFQKLSEKIKEEMMKLLDSAPHQIERQQELMKKFDEENSSSISLISFDYTKYQSESTDVVDSLANAISSCIEKNLKDLMSYRESVEQSLQKIEDQRQAQTKHLDQLSSVMKEKQDALDEKEKEKSHQTNIITKHKTTVGNLERKLSELYSEKEDLLRNLAERKQNQLSDIEQIQCFIEALKAKSNKQNSSQLNSESSTSSVSTNNTESLKPHDELLESFEMISDSVKISVMNQTINDQIIEATALLTNLQSFDEQIGMINKKLLTAQKRKTSQGKSIAELEADKDADTDGIEDAKQELEKIKETIRSSEEKLNKLNQEKASQLYNNHLLNKIRQMFQSDHHQERQTMQEMLEKVSHQVQSLNQVKEKVSNGLTSGEQQLADHDQSISDLTNITEQLQIEKEKYQSQLQCNHALHRIATELDRSLVNSEQLLQTSLKRCQELCEAKKLIDEYHALTSTLKSNTDENTCLESTCSDLFQKLNEINRNRHQYSHPDSQSCQTAYEEADKNYRHADDEVQKLEKELAALAEYTKLQNEIERLEKEARKNCSCGTDHKCSGICQICAAEDVLKRKLCIFKAGHIGQHTCDDKHICIHSCRLCEICDNTSNRCHFAYGHTEPSYHQCKGPHQCLKTCSSCSDPCAIPYEEQHQENHRCKSQICKKSCIFSCGNQCASEDHDHDAKAETVILSVGQEKQAMKLHLCTQSHRCKGICDGPGVCKREYKAQQATYITESGETFPYEYIEVEKPRNECGLRIDAGKTSHAESPYHHCGGEHTCEQRCPDCSSFCREPLGHEGKHRTIHRNKDLHVFTGTDPAQQIQFFSNDTSKRTVRKYKLGESSKPEKCGDSCKRRGRSHFHLLECPGDSNCWELKLPSKAKHSDEKYCLGLNNEIDKKYDQILCSTYWSLMGWISPVDDKDRKLIDTCNTYCLKHVETVNEWTTIPETIKGFCTLEAWHAGCHKLECEREHPKLATYQGVDICFVIDTTKSMEKYLDKVKETIIRIINDYEEQLKKIKATTSFQFAIVDYRDHSPEAEYVTQKCDFTDYQKAIDYIKQLTSESGGDIPEAVLDALDAACGLTWRDKADHLLFHVLDAPPHGRKYFSGNDRWPGGCPCGKKAEAVLSPMKKKKIDYHVLYCSNLLNMMIKKFEKYIKVNKLEFNEQITFDGIITEQVYRQLVNMELTFKKTD